jgi:hypothetical protein
MGGLGNQLFQYAYARGLKELGYSVGLDIQTFYQEDNYKPGTTFRDYLLDKFQISIPPVNIYKSGYGFILRGFKYQNSLVRKLFKFVFFFWHKNHFINCDNLTRYDPALLDIRKNCYISGYFQSIKYFSSIKDVLKNELKPTEKLAENFYCNFIESQNRSNTVAIHIRRGDYTGSGNELPFTYYQNAVDYMAKKLNGSLQLFIFSDDIQYVRHNFSFSHQAFWVNEDRSLNDFEEFITMSKCRHFIIANSSFSWWAAWLSSNDKKIICAPNQWVANPDDYRDIIPDCFIKIPY